MTRDFHSCADMEERKQLFGIPVNSECSTKIRCVIFSWIYELHLQMKCENVSTFPNTVMLFDSIMSKVFVEKADFKLIATICFWISIKLYEVQTFPAQEMVDWCFYKSTNVPTIYKFVDMERAVQHIVDFNCMIEKPIDFITEMYFERCGKKDSYPFILMKNLSNRYLFDPDYQWLSSKEIAESCYNYMNLFCGTDPNLIPSGHEATLDKITKPQKWMDEHLKVT